MLWGKPKAYYLMSNVCEEERMGPIVECEVVAGVRGWVITLEQ